MPADTLSTVTKPSTLFSILIFCSIILSCKSQATGDDDWWQKPRLEWPQILLTNHLEFDGRNTVEGASAFLLRNDSDTVLCTVRHILEKPMGIKPPVPQDSVNYLLKNWSLAPRATTGFDSLRVQSLINTKPSDDDLLVLSLKKQSREITSLLPSPTLAVKGEKVFIIGCENKSKDCNQNVWEATVAVSDSTQLIIEPASKFVAAGFSGAPVVNVEGKLVGMVYGVYNGEEGFFLYLVPVSKLTPFLEQLSLSAE